MLSSFIQDKGFSFRRLAFPVLLAGIVRRLLRNAKRGLERQQMRGLMGLKELGFGSQKFMIVAFGAAVRGGGKNAALNGAAG